jgi:hypothetical protein
VAGKGKETIQEGLNRIAELLAERDRESYEALRGRLREAREVFHELLADRFERGFNERLTKNSHSTYAEKLKIACRSNADLRLLGLAAACPKTGRPAVLHASPTEASGGRLQTELIDSDPPRQRTFSGRQLPALKLVGFPDRGDARRRARLDRGR